MRTALVVMALISAVAVACASDADAPLSDTPASTAGSAPSPTASASEASPQADFSPATGGEAEATGIVGAVDETHAVIEIRPTGGGTITRVEVAPGASIRLATGGSLALGEIRSSDRIVASGVQGDTPDTIVADRIEVSRVIPGAAPGG